MSITSTYSSIVQEAVSKSAVGGMAVVNMTALVNQACAIGPVQVVLSTVDVNNGMGLITTTPNTIKVLVAGMYRVMGRVTFSGPPNNTTCACDILVNGSIVRGQDHTTAVANGAITVATAFLLTLDRDSLVTMQVNSTATKTITGAAGQRPRLTVLKLD